ncbi:nitroreductase [Cricetibacter osteomyelitidis]|uniref:Nitroreductase n=1 Tax=Cricetibacter osteomyelitidis TaxID=1521931 RepID=A0A4R2SXL7_9PAST|nr:NAD(P)H-dependent oxidoreductase [Cricetibacter osteomyelitidis]TCP95237.1 nitroreductase [Cricetibacter osteomyelitidis]
MAITKQDVLDVFHNRAATRYYDPAKKISDEDFAYILELGRLSPSSVGSEPWKFVVVQNKALLDAIKPVGWGVARQLDDCSHLLVILAKKNARYDSEMFSKALDKRGLTEEQKAKALGVYKSFQENDIKVLESERAIFDWACKQTYIALGNMMTGAKMIGIDSCPIEGFNYDAVNQLFVDAGVFDPQEWGISVMVTFGYRARDIVPKSRKSVEEVVQWVR